MMRFEAPVGKNRWDKPLFTLKKDEEVNFDAISSALFDTKPPARNMSTVSVSMCAAVIGQLLLVEVDVRDLILVDV